MARSARNTVIHHQATVKLSNVRKKGFDIFESQPSQLHDGHFKTYLEMTGENEIPK